MNRHFISFKTSLSIMMSIGLSISTLKASHQHALDPSETPAQHKVSVHPSAFSEIKDKYDLFLVDIMGVVHNGVNGFTACIETLNTLHQPPYSKRILFLSNTQRLSAASKQTIMKFGIDDEMTVFTSGDAIRQSLAQRGPTRVYHFGEALNPFLLEGLKDIQVTNKLEEAEIILLSHYIKDQEDVDQFDPSLKEIAATKCPILCVNPDKTAPRGDGFYYCAGTFAQKIEQYGGQVRYYGKPSASIYEIIKTLYPDIPKAKILMIGDTLETDIQGAVNFGIDSLLVLTGNTKKDIDASHQSPTAFLKAQPIQPTYVMSSLIL